MDKRAIKRLLLILVVSLAIIMLAKFMLTKTVANLNQAAAEKKQTAIRQQMPAPPVVAPVVETPETAVASAVMELDAPASSRNPI